MLFHVLGPLETATRGGHPHGQLARKPAIVLAMLLLHANRWVRVDQLISATWPDRAAPASAYGNLKTYVWQLRQTLPESVDGRRIDGRPGAYRLRVGPGELDAVRAEGLGEDARQALHDGYLAKAVELFSEAIDLWRGEPFDGMALEDTTGTLAWLAELRRDLREGLAEAYAGLGRTREAITLLRALTDEDPFREGSWARWMLVLNDCGRRGAALAVYERVRTILAGELGAEPGRELRDALRAVRRGERARRPDRRRDLTRDVPDFTGMADEVERLLALAASGTHGAPVAVIDGMPGVGKTTLAVHVAHRLASSFSDTALQVELGAAGPAEVLGRLLRALGMSDEDIPDDLPDRAALWRAELAGRRALVLLDDARDTEQVRPLLPGGPGSVALVTTRSRTLRPAGACPVTLSPLPPPRAAELFRKVANRGEHADTSAVDDVVLRCGGLPAAVRAAADCLHGRPMWTVDRLAERLAAGGVAELAPALGPLREAAGSLPRRAHQVLAALASLPVEVCEVTVADVGAAAGCAVEQARSGLEHLLDRHLVEQPSVGHFRLHPVVRLAVGRRPEVHDGQ